MSELQAPAPTSAADLIPGHVAIIMDGNHRWARMRHLPGPAGHRAGVKNVKKVARACADLGVQCLTLFAFSTENWQRPPREVTLLMELMRNYFENDLDELMTHEVRLRIIGDRSRFAPDLQMHMTRAEAMTRANTRMTLNIAVNFGGRWDIAQATRRIAQDVAQGKLDADSISESTVDAYLSLTEVDPPDLCIRTGGEHRISNFLLWQFAYTELYFTDALWPDFDTEALMQALQAFAQRHRRYGRRS